MKDIMFRKIFVVGIIALFVGASVAVPNIKMLTNVENVFSARAMETLDGVPFEPIDPSPENNSENISINPAISVFVTDPDNDTMNVSFFASDDSFIDGVEDVQNGTRAEVIWSDLEYNTTYSWYAIANDSIFENRSKTWFFTTIINHPPNEPIDPSPENNSENISINPAISVFVTDPDNDTMNVSFFASNTSHIGNVYNVPNGSKAEVIWSDLQYNTTYSWYAVADDGEYTNQSDTWNFTTTANHPPNEPSNPNPEDDATDVDIDADLSWIGGDPDGDSVTYDIYLEADDSTPDVKVADDITETTFDPGALEYNTTYYWQIISWDSQGASTEGPIWHFTTKALLPLEVNIIKPKERSFYLDNEKLFPLIMNTIVYGPIDIEVNATSGAEIDRVEFYINNQDEPVFVDDEAPYSHEWKPIICGPYKIKVIAYDDAGQNASAEINVLKWRIHPVLLLAGTMFIFRQLRSGTPFQWTILRGTVFNLKQVGNKYHGRAIRLHYTEIAPFSSVSGTGTIKLRKITFARAPFMLSHDIGPVGLTTYIFGIFPGKINRILA